MTTVLNTGQWYHVAATYSGVGGQDAQDGMIIYVDGVPATVTETIVGAYQAMPNLSIDAYIGKLDTSYANGKIDAVAIYNYELSQDQVTTLYGTGSAIGNPMALTSPPKAYYPLGTSAWNGEYLAENNAIGDYVFDFDAASSDYIDCGDSDNFSFGNGTTDSPFSVSAWINITATTSQGIVTKYGSSTSLREWLFYTTGGKIRLLLWSGSTNNIATSSTVLSTNTWYHVVCTYDGRGGSTAYDGINIYLNSILESVTTNGGSYTAMSNTSQPVQIATHSGGSFLDGSISNVSIWNTELTSTQVTELYNNGTPSNLSSHSATSNLISWWKLDASDTYDSSTGNWTIEDHAGSNYGTSSGMSQANLVQSDLQTVAPYSKYAIKFEAAGGNERIEGIGKYSW